jgi:hypothetical protein
MASHIALGAILLLGAVLAWRMRRPWSEPATWGDLAREWAAVTALTALLSPVCWLQHMVLLWPAAFLILRRMLTHRPSKPLWAAIGLVALCTLVLQRGVLGRQLGIIALTYHLPTIAAMILVVLVLLPPPQRPAPAPPVDTR